MRKLSFLQNILQQEDVFKVLGEWNSLLHKRTRMRLAEKSLYQFSKMRQQMEIMKVLLDLDFLIANCELRIGITPLFAIAQTPIFRAFTESLRTPEYSSY